uniref:Uncharacterized protein n=1 Tax=Anguilla anguilla TaxID=7936 RepID=A0A0E9T0A3_ANGAN
MQITFYILKLNAIINFHNRLPISLINIVMRIWVIWGDFFIFEYIYSVRKWKVI